MAADESLIIVSGRLLRSQFISLNTFHQTENYTKIKAASGQQKRTKIVLANKCSSRRTPLHHVCSSYCSSPLCNQLQAISPPSASHSCGLYLRFPRLLIVSLPCYCLPLLSINLSNKLGSLQRRQVCKIPPPLLIHSWFPMAAPLWRSDNLPQSELYLLSFSRPSPPAVTPQRIPSVNCGSGEVCLTSFQGHALLGPFSPLKGHIISQPPTSH